MRERFCSASLFVTMAGILVALFVIQVPVNVWWDKTLTPAQMPLFAWVIVNILGPAACLAMAAIVAYGLWILSVHVCRKLRREPK